MINNTYDGSGERLFCIRKALGMTQIEFSKIVNSSNGHVSDMEKDRKNITKSTIELLKLKCNVNETWLRTGTGEMFSKTSSSIMEQLKREFDLDDFSFNLVHGYLKLAPAQREKVRDFFYHAINSEAVNGYTIDKDEDDITNMTVEELEAEYKKSISASARSKGYAASSTTAGTANNHGKAAGQ